VAGDIQPGAKNVVALYVLLSAGDTRRSRSNQRFEDKEIGEILIYFRDSEEPQHVSLKLGIEIREWASGDMTWDVMKRASIAKEVWRSQDGGHTLDMIRVDIKDGPRDVSKLIVIGECKWLPNDYTGDIPSIRISGVTYKTKTQK